MAESHTRDLGEAAAGRPVPPDTLILPCTVPCNPPGTTVSTRFPPPPALGAPLTWQISWCPVYMLREMTSELCSPVAPAVLLSSDFLS